QRAGDHSVERQGIDDGPGKSGIHCHVWCPFLSVFLRSAGGAGMGPGARLLLTRELSLRDRTSSARCQTASDKGGFIPPSPRIGVSEILELEDAGGPVLPGGGAPEPGRALLQIGAVLIGNRRKRRLDGIRQAVEGAGGGRRVIGPAES